MKRFNPFFVFTCCASDPLFMKATIPVGAYASGQVIHVDLELTNNSNEHIQAFVIQIIRVSKVNKVSHANCILPMETVLKSCRPNIRMDGVLKLCSEFNRIDLGD